jgi:hypothetical protein
MNGQQGGDPARLARALVTLSDCGDLPLRCVAGADAMAAIEDDAMAAIEDNVKTIQGQIDAHGDLSAFLSYDS